MAVEVCVVGLNVGRHRAGLAVAATLLLVQGCSGSDADPAAEAGPAAAGAASSPGSEAAPPGTGAPSQSGVRSDGPRGATSSPGSGEGSTDPGRTAPPGTPDEVDPPGEGQVGAETVSGTVVSATEGRATVQANRSEVVVVWGPAVEIVRLGSLDRKKIKVGACVLALPQRGDGVQGQDFSAGLVRVLASSGRCQGAQGGADGQDGRDPGGSVTMDGPGVVGAVTEVSGTTLVVRPSSGPSESLVTVTTTSQTRYTSAATQDAAPAGTTIEAGDCLTAYGAASPSGEGVRATRLRVSDPGPGRCPEVSVS